MGLTLMPRLPSFPLRLRGWKVPALMPEMVEVFLTAGCILLSKMAEDEP